MEDAKNLREKLTRIEYLEKEINKRFNGTSSVRDALNRPLACDSIYEWNVLLYNLKELYALDELLAYHRYMTERLCEVESKLEDATRIASEANMVAETAKVMAANARFDLENYAHAKKAKIDKSVLWGLKWRLMRDLGSSCSDEAHKIFRDKIDNAILEILGKEERP